MVKVVKVSFATFPSGTKVLRRTHVNQDTNLLCHLQWSMVNE